MCGFPGLAMFSLLEGEDEKSSEKQKLESDFKQVFLHAVETMLPYTTPYVYPGNYPVYVIFLTQNFLCVLLFIYCNSKNDGNKNV